MPLTKLNPWLDDPIHYLSGGIVAIELKHFIDRHRKLASGIYQFPYRLHPENPGMILFHEMRGWGAPPDDHGYPGDIYLDLTPSPHIIYWHSMDSWECWNWCPWTDHQQPPLPQHPFLADRYMRGTSSGISWWSSKALRAAGINPRNRQDPSSMISDILGPKWGFKNISVSNLQRKQKEEQRRLQARLEWTGWGWGDSRPSLEVEQAAQNARREEEGEVPESLKRKRTNSPFSPMQRPKVHVPTSQHSSCSDPTSGSNSNHPSDVERINGHIVFDKAPIKSSTAHDLEPHNATTPWENEEEEDAPQRTITPSRTHSPSPVVKIEDSLSGGLSTRAAAFSAYIKESEQSRLDAQRELAKSQKYALELSQKIEEENSARLRVEAELKAAKEDSLAASRTQEQQFKEIILLKDQLYEALVEKEKSDEARLASDRKFLDLKLQLRVLASD